MAIKIPNAPDVIGTQPVLRQPEPINAKFENPTFKIDVSSQTQAIKNVGDTYADYVDQQTEILMGAACNQFHHDVLQEEESLKANNKGAMANDLYARLEKKATAVLDDITGEPKEDGRIRIANPELQRRFRDWASRQMPAYQARMTHYTATELEKANKSILEDGIKKVNDVVMNATTSEELITAKEEYIRAARLSSPGMPQSYQMAQAARMMDEAVLNKMNTLAKTNIVKAINMYSQIPEIGAVMSNTSEAALWKTMQDNFKEQGGSSVADRLDSEMSSYDNNPYTDKNIVRLVFFPDSKPEEHEAEVDRIITDVIKEGDKIHSAAKEARRGQLEREHALLQNKIVNTDITDDKAVANTAMAIAQVDDKLANQFVRGAQEQLYEDSILSEYEKRFPNGDEALEDWKTRGKAAAKDEYDSLKGKFRAERGYGTNNKEDNDKIDADFVKLYGTKKEYVANKKATALSTYEYKNKSLEADMARMFGEETTRDLFDSEHSIDFQPRELSAEDAHILREQRRIIAKTAEWVNSPVYARIYAEAIDGRYNGEYRPELDGCPNELKNNLATVVEYNRRYNEVIAANPQLRSDVVNALPKAKKKNNYFVSSVQREIVKGFDDYSRHNNGAYPAKGSIQYTNIVNQAIHNAVSPTEARVGAYLNEQQIELLQKANADQYLNPKQSLSILKENNVLPNEAVVLLNNDYSAESIADAIIDTAEGSKKRRLEQFRDAMIQTIEATGNYDGWFLFADTIGQY